MVTAVAVVTGCVVMAKLAVVAPAATVTDAGTAPAALLLARVTTGPPAGAAEVSVTVPVLPIPPTTAVGFSVTAFSAAGGFTVRVAAFATPLEVAVMVTAVAVGTGFVVMAKLAVVAPAATVTDAGTAPAALLLARVTTAPPAGAAEVSVTVPVLPVPPITAVGFSVKAFSAAGAFTVSVAAFATPL